MSVITPATKPPSASTPNSPSSTRKFSSDAIFYKENTPTSPLRPIKSINDLNREYSDISIRNDPASPYSSRRNSDVSLIDDSRSRPRSRFHVPPIHHSLDYDRELVRRQYAMIATQPMNTSEEIDEKRRLLRMKVEARKRADDITKSGGLLGLGQIGRAPSVNKSPSPTPPIIPKVVISKTKDSSSSKGVKTNDQHNGIQTNKGPSKQLKAPLSPRKGRKNATQAAKVTKKVVSGANKSTLTKTAK